MRLFNILRVVLRGRTAERADSLGSWRHFDILACSGGVQAVSLIRSGRFEQCIADVGEAFRRRDPQWR